jgi:hypothetical protein
MLSGKQGGALPTRRFAVWSIACWVVLLLAAFGCLQYLRHGDYPYLIVALLIVVVSAGCILRQSWARQAMRILCVLLALWALVTGGLMLAQWGQFEQARQHAMTQPQLAGMMLILIEQAQRTYVLSLVLKALLIPLLLWLAWRLGQPIVQAQFRTRC